MLLLNEQTRCKCQEMNLVFQVKRGLVSRPNAASDGSVVPGLDWIALYKQVSTFELVPPYMYKQIN